MTKKTFWIAATVAVNVALLPLTLTSPWWSFGWRDCCRERGNESYCCYDCCWFTANCNSDIHCRDADRIDPERR